TTSPGDGPKRGMELGPTVATLRSEHVSGQTLRVHAYQHGSTSWNPSLHERDVMIALEPALVEMELEATFGRRQRDRDQPPHQHLLLPPVGDEVLDGEDPEPMLAREALEIGQAGHVPVLA